MARTRIIEHGESDTWYDFVDSQAAGSIYHTRGWASVIASTFALKALHVVATDASGMITGGIPLFMVDNRLSSKRLTSVPFAHFCDPLVSSQRDYDLLLERILEFSRGNGIKYTELKTSGGFKLSTDRYGTPETSYSTHTLDLAPDLKKLMGSFHKSCVQRAIKKSVESGITLCPGGSIEDVHVFYRLYLNMRRTNGLLSAPFAFFANMWETFSGCGNIEILHAMHQGEIISSILTLKYGDKVTYEYGASDYGKLNLRPSHFLLWEAIKRARAEGFKEFDFGRTANDNTSLFKFKERWGTKMVPLKYFYMPITTDYTAVKDLNLPRAVMGYTIRHMPAFYSRLMGGLLYGMVL